MLHHNGANRMLRESFVINGGERLMKFIRWHVSWAIVLLRRHRSAGMHHVPKQQPDRQHNSSGNIVEPIAVNHGVHNGEDECLLVGAVASQEQRYRGIVRKVQIGVTQHNDRRRDERMQCDPSDIPQTAESEKVNATEKKMVSMTVKVALHEINGKKFRLRSPGQRIVMWHYQQDNRYIYNGCQ